MPQQGTDEMVPGAQAAISQIGGQGLLPGPEGQQPQPQMEQPPVGAAPQQETLDLKKILDDTNLASEMEDEELAKIGDTCKRGFQDDWDSRKDWMQQTETWLSLAKQEREQKNFPWAGASNIKYPMMSTAAMQFSARAYPSLVPANGEYVQAKVFGSSNDDELNKRATRVADYMSYQLAHEIQGWEEDTDRLLMQLAVVGVMFRKTWWDPSIEQIRSESVSSADLVVNYWTKSLAKAERISHQFRLYKREIKTLQRQEIYRDFDLPVNSEPEGDYSDKDAPSTSDESVRPYDLVEQHCYLELGELEFPAPYIVTFIKDTGHVLRITANFDENKIRTNSKNEIVSLAPNQYFTKYPFIPNPDGSFYDMGFGHLLGPLNEAVNTLVNQLTDAGTLNNMQSGFISKNLRIKGGDYAFQLGEWKTVNSTMDDMRKQILQLPSKEPSATLLKTLELLIQSGKELASVAEIFVGKMPGQNTPATTTMASIEQGMKVFTAIYKRIYRALQEEYLLIFKLNHSYMNANTTAAVLESPIGPNDFDITTMRIVPSADPSASSQQEALAKSKAVMELLPTGYINAKEAITRHLKAMEQPDIDKLIKEPPPPKPDPAQAKAAIDQKLAETKTQGIQAKSQADQAKAAMDREQAQEKHALEMNSAEGQAGMKQYTQENDAKHAARMQAIKEDGAEKDQARKASDSKSSKSKEKRK